MEEIKINDSKKIVIGNDEFKNVKFVSIREWYLDSTDEWKPGKSGITIKKDQWEEFQALIMRLEPEF